MRKTNIRNGSTKLMPLWPPKWTKINAVTPSAAR
jgi:hypothetical protein